MKSIFFSLILLFGFSLVSHAQEQKDDAKVIAVINRADWCGTCKANEARFKENVLADVMKNSDYRILMNDLSDDNTKKASKKMLKKAGIKNFSAEHKKTGMVYFVDPETKKTVSKISIAEPDDTLKEAFANALEN